MIKKKFKLSTDYDYALDIYTITVDDNFEFNRSLELEDGVILDFDKEGRPISIEILDVSKKLGINKQEVNSSKVFMQITCDLDVLNVEIVFYYKVHEKAFEKHYNSKLANNFNIPPIIMASV